jgi:ferredoxin-NADP reductase
MRSEEMMQTARSMIERHGLRAQAVALERASEMQVKGDTAEFARWRQIRDLICEFHRTRREAQAAV